MYVTVFDELGVHSVLTLSEKLSWAEQQPWATAMKNCAQEPEWHGEGNVWTHTKMVCEALEPMLDKLPEEESQALQWAAVLHDVGKPHVRTVEDGRIRTRNHSAVGHLIARHILLLLEVDFHIRENACALIRWHGYPLNVHRQEDPGYYVIGTSCLCKNSLLHKLTVADNKGRIVSSHLREESETVIELWEEQCHRFNCYYHPYTGFINEEARFQFYQTKCFRPYYVPYIKDMFVVHMTCGLPGVGKSRYVMQELSNLPVICLDDIREEMGIKPATSSDGKVTQEAKKRCRGFLAKKQGFVFDATNLIQDVRRKWIMIFHGYRAMTHIHFIDAPFSAILAQNSERKEDSFFECNGRKRMSKHVPEHVIEHMAKRMFMPTLAECHKLSLRQNVG